MAMLAANSYGKSGVRVARVVRPGSGGGRHEVYEYEVAMALTGEFGKVYTEGDNSACVPTDTMKNTVYALAAQHEVDSPEGFGRILAGHFVEKFGHVSRATVGLEQTVWERIEVAGQAHEHAFTKGAYRRTAQVQRMRGGATEVVGGITGLEVLKTTRSSFCGFLVDEYTTLKDAAERIFATTIDATWTFAPAAAELRGADYNGLAEVVRRTLLEVFAGHDSKGVQQTLYAMGEAVLAAAAGVEEIRLSLPNQHRILANIGVFNLPNENEVFVTTREPYGVIQGTVRR